MKYNTLNGTNVDTVDTDYSCELNDSKSESDEEHTGTATAHVHYFINNVMQFKYLWKGAA